MEEKENKNEGVEGLYHDEIPSGCLVISGIFGLVVLLFLGVVGYTALSLF